MGIACDSFSDSSLAAAGVASGIGYPSGAVGGAGSAVATAGGLPASGSSVAWLGCQGAGPSAGR